MPGEPTAVDFDFIVATLSASVFDGALPRAVFQIGLTLFRYEVQMNVVPEPSDR